nr:3 beta-hydroxysteroid dehydrogenase/delta 5->4 isomerase [Wadden Sea poxvirus]
MSSIYAITGGCGFIGSYITKLLLKYDKSIKEIRIIDININKKIDDSRVIYTACNIMDIDKLILVLTGVDLVIHSAAIVDVFGKNDDFTIYNINFNGTKNIITACIASGVRYLIYTSSMEVIGPNKYGTPFVGNEDTEYVPEHKHRYPYSKAEAEKLVLIVNGSKVKGGNTLKTCSLRPTGVYGEGNMLLKNIYDTCKRNDYKIPLTVKHGTRHSRVYVGNVAWMHVLVVRNIQFRSSVVPGNVYYCYDNSPVCEYDKFNILLMKKINVKEGKRIPYCLLRTSATINDLARCVLKPIIKISPMLNKHTLMIANTTFEVKTNKAFFDFGYTPLFTVEESFDRTTNWLIEKN